MSKKLCLTLLGLIPIIILTSLLNSCGKKSSSGKVRLAFVTNASADFWAYAQAGVQKAESEFDDIEVEFKVGDGTPAKQRELIEAH